MHIQSDGTATRDNRKEINTCHVSKVIRTVFYIRVSAAKKEKDTKEDGLRITCILTNLDM